MKLSIHTRHDANVTVFDGDNIIIYLEIEKIANIRYFGFSANKQEFIKQFNEYVAPYIIGFEIDTIIGCWLTDGQKDGLIDIFGENIRFENVNHHISHVNSAYVFTDARNDDLILSIDGGGDLDDYFYIYERNGDEFKLLKEVKVNLGKAYRIIGLLSPELYKHQDKGYMMDHALSGKKMSLQSYGNIVSDYMQPVRDYYYNFMDEYDEANDDVTKNLSVLLSKIGHGDKKFLDALTARDILATSQYVFEQIVTEYLYPFLKSQKYRRLVVVGGCALNVKLTSMINDQLGIEIFTPPCANDGGISLGAAKIHNPTLKKLESPFIKTSIKNKDHVNQFKSNYTHKQCSLAEIAKMLAGGKTIATVVGDIEIGPRALGNRSYLASPLIKGMKNKLNSKNMKDREIWRPVAPIVTSDKLTEYFDTNLASPYMTFAPQIKQDKRELLKEIMHIDGSARVQTVEKDNWVYHLIKEFGKITGTEVIMNTSFNSRGCPLINDLSEAFDIFVNSELDAIVIDFDQPSHESKLMVYFKD